MRGRSAITWPSTTSSAVIVPVDASAEGAGVGRGAGAATGFGVGFGAGFAAATCFGGGAAGAGFFADFFADFFAGAAFFFAGAAFLAAGRALVFFFPGAFFAVFFFTATAQFYAELGGDTATFSPRANPATRL